MRKVSAYIVEIMQVIPETRLEAERCARALTPFIFPPHDMDMLEAKAWAAHLRSKSREIGVTLSESSSLTILARMLGHESWSDAQARISHKDAARLREGTALNTSAAGKKGEYLAWIPLGAHRAVLDIRASILDLYVRGRKSLRVGVVVESTSDLEMLRQTLQRQQATFPKLRTFLMAAGQEGVWINDKHQPGPVGSLAALMEHNCDMVIHDGDMTVDRNPLHPALNKRMQFVLGHSSLLSERRDSFTHSSSSRAITLRGGSRHSIQALLKPRIVDAPMKIRIPSPEEFEVILAARRASSAKPEPEGDGGPSM